MARSDCGQAPRPHGVRLLRASMLPIHGQQMRTSGSTFHMTAALPSFAMRRTCELRCRSLRLISIRESAANRCNGDPNLQDVQEELKSGPHSDRSAAVDLRTLLNAVADLRL